jgi:hypothetical protein
LEYSNPKLFKQIKDRTDTYKRSNQDSSRFFNIINLTKFKKSYELDLKTPELLFDPIYENMVFLMKFTIIICEKIKRFFIHKKTEAGITDEKKTTLFRIQLSSEEKSTVKSLTYRVVFYISQLRNFMMSALQKNIITPKFYLLYTREYPGEYNSLRDMQTNINGLALEQFIKTHKEKLESIDIYFRRNTMKFLTIRSFKRVFEKKYLKDSILVPMSYFKVTPEFRYSLCEFFYFYNILSDFYYIFQPKYMTVEYKEYKNKQTGNGSEIMNHKSTLKAKDFSNIVYDHNRVPKPTNNEISEVNKTLMKKDLGLILGKMALDNIINNSENDLSNRESRERFESFSMLQNQIKKNLDMNKYQQKRIQALKDSENEIEKINENENLEMQELQDLDNKEDNEDPISMELEETKSEPVNADAHVLTEQEKDIREQELADKIEVDEEQKLKDELDLAIKAKELNEMSGKKVDKALNDKIEQLEDNVLMKEGSVEDIEEFKRSQNENRNESMDLNDSPFQALESTINGEDVINSEDIQFNKMESEEEQKSVDKGGMMLKKII